MSGLLPYAHTHTVMHITEVTNSKLCEEGFIDRSNNNILCTAHACTVPGQE